jgi:hypothetical protein
MSIINGCRKNKHYSILLYSKIETKTNLVRFYKDWKRNKLLVSKLLKIEAKTNWLVKQFLRAKEK